MYVDTVREKKIGEIEVDFNGQTTAQPVQLGKVHVSSDEGSIWGTEKDFKICGEWKLKFIVMLSSGKYCAFSLRFREQHSKRYKVPYSVPLVSFGS